MVIPPLNESRLTALERWTDRHETKCDGRHEALKLRLDTAAERLERVEATAIALKNDLGTRLTTQDFWAILRWGALMTMGAVAMSGGPKAVVEFLVALVK